VNDLSRRQIKVEKLEAIVELSVLIESCPFVYETSA
jgi:hypothetical protein